MKRFQTLLLILVLGVGQVTQSDAARRLTSGDAVANDQLGSRVAISGDYAIVGVERDDGEGGEDSVLCTSSSEAQPHGRLKHDSPPAI